MCQRWEFNFVWSSAALIIISWSHAQLFLASACRIWNSFYMLPSRPFDFRILTLNCWWITISLSLSLSNASIVFSFHCFYNCYFPKPLKPMRLCSSQCITFPSISFQVATTEHLTIVITAGQMPAVPHLSVLPAGQGRLFLSLNLLPYDHSWH